MASSRSTISDLLSQLKTGAIDKEQLFSKLTELQKSPMAGARAAAPPAAAAAAPAAAEVASSGGVAPASTAAARNNARVAALARESFNDATSLVSPAADAPPPANKRREGGASARGALHSRLAESGASASAAAAADRSRSSSSSAARSAPPSMYDFLSRGRSNSSASSSNAPLPPPPPAANQRSAVRATRRRRASALLQRDDLVSAGLGAHAAAPDAPLPRPGAAAASLSATSRLLKPTRSSAIKRESEATAAEGGDAPGAAAAATASLSSTRTAKTAAAAAAERLRRESLLSPATAHRRKTAEVEARERSSFRYAPIVKPVPGKIYGGGNAPLRGSGGGAASDGSAARRSGSFAKRSTAWKRRKEEEAEKAAREKAQLAMQECTFKPRLNSVSKAKAGVLRRAVPKGDPMALVERLHREDERRQQRIIAARTKATVEREAQLHAVCTFKPTLYDAAGPGGAGAGEGGAGAGEAGGARSAGPPSEAAVATRKLRVALKTKGKTSVVRLFTGPKGTKAKRLSAVEFRKSLRRGGVAKELLSDHHAQCIFHAIDGDADGLISVGEITGYFARSAPHARAATAANASAASGGAKKGAAKKENQKPAVLPTGEEECTFAPQTNELKSEMVRHPSVRPSSAPRPRSVRSAVRAHRLPPISTLTLSPPPAPPICTATMSPIPAGLGAAVPPDRLLRAPQHAGEAAAAAEAKGVDELAAVAEPADSRRGASPQRSG